MNEGIALELSELEWLIAVEEIKQMKARRDLAVDRKEWATYQSLHVEDFISYKDDGDWVGAKVATESAARALEKAVTVHHSLSPIITIHDQFNASGLWTMKDYIFWEQDGEPHWLRGYGHYDETYVKRHGKWLFSSRRLTRVRVDTSPGAAFPSG